ncbi:hypothetical protein CC1G_14361 [Coprinopsis cinerea okayama7|uniref:Uncharacterized protein n=1 Tax=Coprinopsis cinerea (strain Okayama-7 / 130 / ATCC MYA-4618 / FGSC 9003) TaxID=240176 RepID=D6RM10_COPC7|nr:hypothetical protein CC1G_14361 [Coprinopsis cinerea okayama7\|eukprot:XP_002911362.1 hypothetical protein CC1G_14361 [Coprinopsis cinerea okayama7\
MASAIVQRVENCLGTIRISVPARSWEAAAGGSLEVALDWAWFWQQAGLWGQE